MFGLPSDVDLSFFQGASLDSFAVGMNDCILHLTKDIQVDLLSAFEVIEGGGQRRFEPPSLGAGALVHLLGKSIVGVHGSHEGNLTLTFSNESQIFLTDLSEMYESYVIHSGDRTIVV